MKNELAVSQGFTIVLSKASSLVYYGDMKIKDGTDGTPVRKG